MSKYKYVVVDFETTGNRVKDGDQIIQIGLCVIEQGEITETFSSNVRPTVKIPAFIEQLTGISEQDVADAPSIEELLPELMKRLDNACFVAHNVHFDLSFYQGILEEHGYLPFKGPIIDTVELSRIIWPEKEGYKLSQLSSDVGVIHENPHQADSDAMAAAQLFIQLCAELEELPLITIQRMIPLAKTLHSDIDTLMRRAESSKILQQALTNQQDHHIEVYRHLALRKDPENEGATKQYHISEETHKAFKSLLQITEEDLHTIKLQDYIGAVLPDYEVRKGQQLFFEHIIHCFRNGQHGLTEVGTGTGKTLAYLFAAALWSYVSGEKVVISTYTIPLQEQVMLKEWPIIKQVLPFSSRISVIKGKQHYVCLSRLEQAFTNVVEERNYDYDLTKLQLLVWLTRTTTGDVEELNLTTGGREFWKRIQTEGSSCFQRDCPWFKRCFYYKAKRDVQQADVIITNHSLLISDEKFGHILPPYHFAIVDEAHHLEQIAVEHLGIKMPYALLHSLFQRFITIDRQALPYQLHAIFQLLIQGEELESRMNQLVDLLHELKVAVDELFTMLHLYCLEKPANALEGNKRLSRIVHDSEQDPLWEQTLQLAELVQETGLKAISSFHKLNGQLEECEISQSQKQTIQDYRRTGEQLFEQVEWLATHLLEADLKNYVYWFEYETQNNKHLMSFQIRPLSVSAYFKESLFTKKESIVLTSATLQVKESFKFYESQLGLEEEDVSTLKVSSPFHYAEQARLFISEDIASLSEGNEAGFITELAESILQVAQITDGRMLVLFTSHRQLRMTHEKLKQALSDQGIFLFAQGIDSGSRMKLTKNFQSQAKAVLLGTSSFWEGIDIPGEDLSCLVIVKLPFTPPNTPYYEAKAEELKRDKKNPFKDYALPQAVIRFKQGFGRLIRRQTDRGIVILFDRRAITARYGRVFLDSLPAIPAEVLDKEKMLHEIKQWFLVVEENKTKN
ncbi:ATP-dependent DNA helicase DinG [Bacillus horti]|uniref:3'-5' exonuclease DinG n=1 Tax=Caldalkalibacillus horti TaxID=77523 RepID=A0ABT9VWZ1_9BACI|nr:ATP-dependent DNA helicase DinG [Bacillus horti]